jgi:hypothetical protein
LLPSGAGGPASSVDQPGDGRAEVGFRSIPKLGNEGMPLERALHDPALHATPAAVDETHLSQPRFMGRLDVVHDHGSDVARREGVKVERVFDGDVVGHMGLPQGVAPAGWLAGSRSESYVGPLRL